MSTQLFLNRSHPLISCQSQPSVLGRGQPPANHMSGPRACLILHAPPLYSIRATPPPQVRKHPSLSGGHDHPGSVLAQIPASYSQTHLESHTQERLWVSGYTPSKAHVSSNNQPSLPVPGTQVHPWDKRMPDPGLPPHQRSML